jgi:hypothetical protein
MRTVSARLPMLLLSILIPSIVAGQAKGDALKALSFMEGQWSGGPSRGLVKSSGAFVIQRDLSRRVLMRRDHVTYTVDAATPNLPVKKGRLDILVVMAPREDGKSFQANYFDSDGHVLNFHSTRVIADSLVEFVSDPVADPVVFHLVYEKVGADGLRIGFGSADVKQPTLVNSLTDGVAKRTGKHGS